MSLWRRWIDQTFHCGLDNDEATQNDDVAPQRSPSRSTSSRGSLPPPMVTLFYDSVKRLTVAVLTRETEMVLRRYFECRARLGSAYQVSPLYYELEGYVRENLFEIRKRLQQEEEESGPANLHCVSVAIGSLEESDAMQRQELQERAESSRARSHGSCDDAVVDGDALERVMEIARLHRLSEDLDVLSIFFMRQVSKAFGRVATKIAQSRLSSIQLAATPYVDGMMVTGYSKAVRRDGEPASTIKLVRHSEGGRLVEYEECPAVTLLPTGSPGQYTPLHIATTETGSFSWKCEEIALANLHRWWGDIAPPDYVGQKLVVSWRVDGTSSDSSLGGCQCPDGGGGWIPLAVLRLPTESRPHHVGGARVHSVRHGRIRLNVLESLRTQSDEVSATYIGRAIVESVSLDFLGLVHGAARRALPLRKQQCREIEDTRPLLPGEESYLRQLESLASAS